MLEIKEFLKKYKMDHESIDLSENIKIFVAEMEEGLTNQPGSLKMIPTYIECNNNIPVDTPIIVIDAGGTNLRTALVKFDKQYNPIIDDLRITQMPGIEKELSKEEFFLQLADDVKRLKDKSDIIGFCFSYPTEIYPNKDGKLIRFCKEIKASSVEGEFIGKNLLNTMNTPNKKVVLLNDTVATLLSGLIKYADKEYDSYIGYILGTGTNSCYIEKTSRIKKIKTNDNNEMIINVESGAYDKVPRGDIDKIFDMKTLNSGEYKFEKAMAGGYLGSLIIEVLKKAKEEGLVSKNVYIKQDASLANINEFINDPYNKDNFIADNIIYEKDRLIIYELILEMIKRASKLAAINIISTVLKTGKGYNPLKPICINIEGTTFYKLKGLKENVEYYLKKYLTEVYYISYELVKVENATLIGTAVAGLTN